MMGLSKIEDIDYKPVKLSPKQRKFADRYLINGFNRSEAVKYAGYLNTQEAARVTAHRLLTNANVKEYVEQRQREMLTQVGVNQYTILKELAFIAFGDIRKFYNKEGGIINPAKLTKQAAAALESIETFEVKDSEGNSLGQVQKLKMNSKLKALELLMKYAGMLEKDNAQKKPDINIFDLTLNIK